MWSCFVMDVFIGEGTNSSNVLFENNIFEAPTGSSGNANNAIYTALTHRTTGSSTTTPSARAGYPS